MFSSGPHIHLFSPDVGRASGAVVDTDSSDVQAELAGLIGSISGLTATESSLFACLISTPIGRMVAVADDDAILLCDFIDRRDIEKAIVRLKVRRRAVIRTQVNSLLQRLATELSEYFSGQRREFTVALQPWGTDFEQRAWEYLRQIPSGQTRTYGQQARALGSPQAARAVGRANGMNFLSILIPCHRVVGQNGSLTGYGGGLSRKNWLIHHESTGQLLLIPPMV